MSIMLVKIKCTETAVKTHCHNLLHEKMFNFLHKFIFWFYHIIPLQANDNRIIGTGGLSSIAAEGSSSSVISTKLKIPDASVDLNVPALVRGKILVVSKG